MTTPVTWAQSVGVSQTAYSSDLSAHRKYAHHHHPAHQYPSIQVSRHFETISRHSETF